MMARDGDRPKIVGNDGTIFKCPMCKALLASTEVKTFPFCSDRCRLMDLNNWMEGNYTTSRPVDPTDFEEELPRAGEPPKRG